MSHCHFIGIPEPNRLSTFDAALILRKASFLAFWLGVMGYRAVMSTLHLVSRCKSSLFLHPTVESVLHSLLQHIWRRSYVNFWRSTIRKVETSFSLYYHNRTMAVMHVVYHYPHGYTVWFFWHAFHSPSCMLLPKINKIGSSLHNFPTWSLLFQIVFSHVYDFQSSDSFSTIRYRNRSL